MNHYPIKIQRILDVCTLLMIILFIASFLDVRLVFWDTMLSGGDSISWYQVANHLKEQLIPNVRLYGWDMANFCGYPNFNFYFIPPFLLAVFISYLGFPLTSGLKIAMAFGWYFLPVSVYLGLRLMAFRFPAPIIGACATLLFLFNETYTMFGGNILSTLAGEFCYMFAFSLLPFFMGSMIKGFSNKKRVIINGLTLGLIGLSHLFVFIPAISVILYGFFTKKRTKYLVQVCAIGFGLMAFWILPLIAWRNLYTVPVYMIWQSFVSIKLFLFSSAILGVLLMPMIAFQNIPLKNNLDHHSSTIFYNIRIAFGILCVIATLTFVNYGLFCIIGSQADIISLSRITGWFFLTVFTAWIIFIVLVTPMGKTACQQFCADAKDTGVVLWLIGVCIIMYCCAHFLKVPDIRFLPPILLIIIILIFSFYVGHYLSFLSLGIQFMSLVFILICVYAIVVLNEKNVQNWYTDTFKGMEHTRGIDDLKELSTYLQANNSLNAPRVGYEKCSRYGPYGGDRVFESLYLYSERQTLEGIHYSSSLASKFLAFLQTEFSKEIKTPTPYILSQINPELLTIHMHLYNISQLILLSPQVKEIFHQSPQFIHEKDIGHFTVFRLKEDSPGYISTLTYPPVLYTGAGWLEGFYHQWFKSVENSKIFFVPSSYVKHPEDRAIFQAQTDVLTVKPSFLINKYPCNTEMESHLSHFKVKFRTSAVGVPHLIRVSYFPNWKVSGAHGVYPVSPHFMMVIPRSNEVILTYSRCIWEILGWFITGFTILALLLAVVWKNNPMTQIMKSIVRRLKKPIECCRPALFWILMLSGVGFSIMGAINRNLPVRMFLNGNSLYNQGMQQKKQMALKEADISFQKAIHTIKPVIDQKDQYDHQDIIHCFLITAKCYTELNKRKKAHEHYDRIIHDYAFSRYIAESYVHKSRLSRKYRDLNLRSGFRIKNSNNGFLKRALIQTQNSTKYLKCAIEKDPYSHWANIASKELQDEERILKQILSIKDKDKL